MTPTLKPSARPFSLAAIALAASLVVAACGGGDPTAAPDTSPPTVTITDSVTEATATGAVTFTFKFSEDVGNSFTAEDVLVSGGTAGDFAKVDATTYTLVVTPAASATGTISVSVAAAKFSDIALNANTAAASGTQAFDTNTAAPTGTVLASFDEATPLELNIFGGTAATLEAGPAGGSGLTLKVVRNGGEPWAGAWVLVPTIPSASGSATITARVYSPTAGIPMVAKIEYADNAGSGDTQASAPIVQGWQTVTWTFNGLDSTKVYNRFVVIPNLNTVDTDKAYYFDDITLTSPASGGGGSTPAACGTTEPTCAPTTVIPSDAVTIYSDAFATAGFNARPDWGQSVVQSVATIAGNSSLKYTFQGGGFGAAGAYEGLEWAPVNVSSKGKLHLDLWSADISSLRISLISAGKENAVTQAVTPGTWNSVDINLSEFTVADKTAIIQIKIESATAGTIYVDNLHFWGTAGDAGSVADPSAAQGSAGAVTIPVLTSPDAIGFAGTGDALFAGDYAGPLDSNNNHALWAGATTIGLAKNGNIGYFQDDALSNSAQKLEENGWVASGLDNPGGVPSFFRYFILTAPASSFTSSYMGLFANAPGNGTVNVSSYGNIKFRLWGPAEMYERTAFNPTLEMTLTGAKVAGCTATGSGGTEIKKSFIANQKIGAASTYKLPLAAWTVVGVCGSDTAATAVSSVLGALARVVVTVPGTSFNFTTANTGGTTVTYATGVNLGPIAFTNN